MAATITTVPPLSFVDLTPPQHSSDNNTTNSNANNQSDDVMITFDYGDQPSPQPSSSAVAPVSSSYAPSLPLRPTTPPRVHFAPTLVTGATPSPIRTATSTDSIDSATDDAAPPVVTASPPPGIAAADVSSPIALSSPSARSSDTAPMLAINIIPPTPHTSVVSPILSSSAAMTSPSTESSTPSPAVVVAPATVIVAAAAAAAAAATPDVTTAVLSSSVPTTATNQPAMNGVHIDKVNGSTTSAAVTTVPVTTNGHGHANGVNGTATVITVTDTKQLDSPTKSSLSRSNSRNQVPPSGDDDSGRRICSWCTCVDRRVIEDNPKAFDTSNIIIAMIGQGVAWVICSALRVSASCHAMAFYDGMALSFAPMVGYLIVTLISHALSRDGIRCAVPRLGLIIQHLVMMFAYGVVLSYMMGIFSITSYYECNASVDVYEAWLPFILFGGGIGVAIIIALATRLWTALNHVSSASVASPPAGIVKRDASPSPAAVSFKTAVAHAAHLKLIDKLDFDTVTSRHHGTATMIVNEQLNDVYTSWITKAPRYQPWIIGVWIVSVFWFLIPVWYRDTHHASESGEGAAKFIVVSEVILGVLIVPFVIGIIELLTSRVVLYTKPARALLHAINRIDQPIELEAFHTLLLRYHDTITTEFASLSATSVYTSVSSILFTTVITIMCFISADVRDYFSNHTPSLATILPIGTICIILLARFIWYASSIGNVLHQCITIIEHRMNHVYHPVRITDTDVPTASIWRSSLATMMVQYWSHASSLYLTIGGVAITKRLFIMVILVTITQLVGYLYLLTYSQMDN